MLPCNLKSSFLFHSWQRWTSYFKGKAQQENRQNQIKSFPSHPGTLAKHQLDEFTVNESETHGLDFSLKVQRRKTEQVKRGTSCRSEQRSEGKRTRLGPSQRMLHCHTGCRGRSYVSPDGILLDVWSQLQLAQGPICSLCTEPSKWLLMFYGVLSFGCTWSRLTKLFFLPGPP